MTQKQLIDGIFAAIGKIVGKAVVPQITYEDSYSGECGTSVYMNFKLRNARRWLFGVWTYQHDGKFTIELFGQYSWFIDKFKPSYSPFHFEFDIDENTETFPMPYVKGHEMECPSEVFRFADAIRGICNSSLGSLVKYYWNDIDGGGYHQGIISWFVSCFCFYEIRQPLAELWSRKLQLIPLTVVRALYKMRYGKKISTYVHPTPEFFSPRVEFYAIYNIEDDESDEFLDTYVDINVRRVADDGTIVYGSRFIPDWLFKYVDLENVTRKDWDSGKRRGFYIPLKFNDNNED